jgi:uncharacterized membrane protein YfcA
MASWLIDLSRRGLAARAAMLVGAVGGVSAVVVPVAGLLGGAADMVAAAVAAAACLAGAVVALAMSHMFRGAQYAVPALVAGMAARMGAPLCAALVYRFQSGAVVGLPCYLLVFYLITLTVETALTLPRSQPRQPTTLSGQAST